MEELILNLLEYIKTRKLEVVLESDGENYKESFITIAIEILGWLKLEHKRSIWKQEKKYVKFKPLSLNLSYPWCQNLCELVQYNSRFNKYFKIESNSFDFSDTISEFEKEVARKMAYEKYTPFSIEQLER